MARKNKNALNSLFQGIAQGLQLNQQIQGQKRARELQEKGFGLKERQFGLNERQIQIQEQQAEAARQNKERTLQFLGPLLQGIIPGLGQQPTQAPAAQQQAPVPIPAPQPRAAPSVPAQTFLPGEFPTTPKGPLAESVLDRSLRDVVSTETELDKVLKQLRAKKSAATFTKENFETVRKRLSEIEQNPKNVKQLKLARRAEELLQQLEQQKQESETLPQVIEQITRDLNITPESRFDPGAVTTPLPTPVAPQAQPAPVIAPAQVSRVTPKVAAPTPKQAEPDIALERSRQIPNNFPLFNTELARIRRQLGLPDFTVSSKDVGIPVDFKFAAPSEKRTIRRLKTAFIADQKGRGINKFDVLAFKNLLEDVGVSTTELQGDLDRAFEEDFRQATSGRVLARLPKAKIGTFERDVLNDMGAKFGSIPKKFEKKANLALSGDRIKVNVKLGNDPKTGRPVSRVGFALKDDPTNIIFIGKPTTAGAAAKITVKNLPQIPSVLLTSITQSDLALRSIGRVQAIMDRVDISGFVGPVDSRIGDVLEAIGLPNKDQQTIGNITTDLTDALGRMRSGGVISLEEEERFKNLVPQRTDNFQTFVNRMNDFKNKMDDIKSVNLEAAKTFGFNVGTSDTGGKSRLDQLLEERKKRVGK